MNFDNVTGNYNIVLTATPANPFVGMFRLNVNLLNPDTTASDSFFTDNQNDFILAVATTSVTLTGTSSLLLTWNAADRVATNDLPFGNPPGVGGFVSNVLNIPFGTGEDRLAFGAAGFTTISLANVSVDLDIDFLRLAGPGVGREPCRLPVRMNIFLGVVNSGMDDQPRIATIVAVQSGAEVYRESLLVSAPVGGDRIVWNFPTFLRTARGSIRWTATILDDDSDNDVAQVFTGIIANPNCK
jgi:hypothetical protein